MSPIENVVPAHINVAEVTLGNKQDRTRDLFGVQLEVTSLLLEAERRKLSVLQRELRIALEEGGSIKAKEHQKQELLAAITRIQAQHDHLDKEYREHALGALISANSRGSGKVRNMQERERPKIAPKPIIATKPKFVPPVKLQQKVPQGPPPPPEPQRRTSCGGEIPKRVQSKFDPGGGAKVFFAQSDKEPLYHQHKKTLEVNQKPPNSPSTVCCSILSNAANDCYGIINSNGKKLTKLDSVDSASSDSGGFKDFHYHHQRKISQPDFLTETKPSGHQRKTSQPNFDNNKPKYVPNAQALAQFLPQTEQKIFMHQQQKVIQQQQQQLEEGRKPKPILSHGNIQESTKKLEELLAQRLEKERMLMMTEKKKMVESAGGEEGGGGGGTAEQKVRQMHQKLHQDLEQTVKQIQEMQSTEYRLPQNRKWESNRSQPAIGLKHTPKSRFFTRSMDDPEIQETVEAILGKGVKVVDCEKKSSIREEEVLYINGIPVALEGREGLAIKEALITGQVPPCDLLNKLLIDSGILKAPVKLDTSLSVTSTTVIKEEVTVSRDGKIVDERSRETKDRSFYTSAMTEIFEPIKMSRSRVELGGGGFCSSSSTSSYESEQGEQRELTPPPRGPKQCLSKDSGHMSSEATTQMSNDSLSSYDETDDLSERLLGQELNRCGTYVVPGGAGYANGFLPTIFGTVAPSDLTPKDCSNRRSLPQTPTIKSYSTIFSSGETHQESPGDSGIQQDNALVYRDGNLLSGPLEALILHTVPTESYYPDRAYLFAFLLSARLFIKPHDLLSKVRHLGEQQQGLAPQQTRFAEKMVQLLAEWTEQFPYDFRDERMMDHVRKVTQQCCAIDPALRSNVSLLLHNLHPKLASLEEYEQLLEKQTNSTITATSSDENISCPDVSEVCPSPEKLAQQLTHLELERLSFIGPEEFVQAFAKENPALETSFKDLKKTRNLEQYVQWFNRLSYFVATQVCKYQKKKQRVKMVEYWIETGRECFNIGNFNSLMAIIAGLNMSPISRLKKTWNKIQSGKFAILEHQMDPSSNFSSYRSTLKAAMWRSAGATDQRQRIVIPFFSLLVKDLYFLNQGCSNKLPNGHINFEKFWQLAKQVTEFMAWKQVTCPFERDPKVIALLQQAAIMNENALALASFECEPPDNNQEKERCKNLKAEGGGGGSSGGSNTN